MLTHMLTYADAYADVGYMRRHVRNVSGMAYAMRHDELVACTYGAEVQLVSKGEV